MGVVIGEIVIVGDYLLIYQGVIFGGIGKEIGKCYFIIGINVVVGVGVKVLGNINIGNNVCIGVGFIVLCYVFFDCIVVGIFGRVVLKFSEWIEVFDYGKFLDIEVIVICVLVEKIQ